MNYFTTDTDLTAVADAIRQKGGTTAPLTYPNGFVSAIQNIPTGGGGDINAIIDSSISGHYENATVTHIGDGKFRNCVNLESVSFPNVTSIGGANVFYNCTSLRSISFPKLGPVVKGYAFQNCSALEMVVLPMGNDFEMSVFERCSSLHTVDAIAGILRANSFAYTALSTLIIRKNNGVSNLAQLNAFANSPFASGGTGGTLYVPQALIASYQAATNWSTILGYATNSIAAIEGSIYETQYADGTPIT